MMEINKHKPVWKRKITTYNTKKNSTYFEYYCDPMFITKLKFHDENLNLWTVSNYIYKLINIAIAPVAKNDVAYNRMVPGEISVSGWYLYTEVWWPNALINSIETVPVSRQTTEIIIRIIFIFRSSERFWVGVVLLTTY